MANFREVIEATRMGGYKGLWYLATPYAKYPFGMETAAQHAAKIAAELINNNVAVFCPIAHGHLIQIGGAKGGHDIWLPLDEMFMLGCVGLIVARMPGYHYSKGVQHEIEWFAKRGIVPLYLDVIEFLQLPPIFSDASLAAEAEAKIMEEPQPMPRSIIGDNDGPWEVGVDIGKPGGDHSAYWVKDVGGKLYEISQAEYERIHADAKARSDKKFADEHGFGDLYAQAAAWHDPREDREYRKQRPITTGVLDYFPLAVAEVARISALGNAQHNLGDAHLHWERTKSNDHVDCIARHLNDRGGVAPDGAHHTANLSWRALALLQEEVEDEYLAMGVRPENVFSRASTWHGKTAVEYFGPVVVDWRGHVANRQDWYDAAEHYWREGRELEETAQAPAGEWSEAEVAAMTEGRAPSEAYKFNKIPVTTMELRDSDFGKNTPAYDAAHVSKHDPAFVAGYEAGLYQQKFQSGVDAAVRDVHLERGG